MKMYHEVAVVKDGNKRVGWLSMKGTVGRNGISVLYWRCYL